jgi:hypothetical protein
MRVAEKKMMRLRRRRPWSGRLTSFIQGFEDEDEEREGVGPGP